jgi:hypothetical protein
MTRHSLLAVLLLAAGTMSASAATPSHGKSPQPEALSAASAATEWSAQRRVRPVRRAHAARPAYGAIGGIACTQFGCAPVPVGCIPVTGYDWYGYPRGNDAVVCQYR